MSFVCQKCGDTFSTWDLTVTQQDGNIVYSCEDCRKNSETKCACIGCDNKATHEWGGRPHCADCMPPMYKLGKNKDFK